MESLQSVLYKCFRRAEVLDDLLAGREAPEALIDFAQVVWQVCHGLIKDLRSGKKIDQVEWAICFIGPRKPAKASALKCRNNVRVADDSAVAVTQGQVPWAHLTPVQLIVSARASGPQVGGPF